MGSCAVHFTCGSGHCTNAVYVVQPTYTEQVACSVYILALLLALSPTKSGIFYVVSEKLCYYQFNPV